TGTLGLAPYVDHPVVASFGSNLSDEQAHLLAKHFSTVVLAYDDDIAGRKGAAEAKKALTKKGVSVLFGMVPDDAEDTGELPHSENPTLTHLTFREWKAITGWKTSYAKRSTISTRSQGQYKVTARKQWSVQNAKVLPWRR